MNWRRCCLALVGGSWLGACSADDRSPSTLVEQIFDRPMPDAGSRAPLEGAGGRPPSAMMTPSVAGSTGAGERQPALPDAGSNASDAERSPAAPDAAPTLMPVPTVMGPCQDCVELFVQLTEPSQTATFQFSFPTPGLDFSAGFVEWRMQVAEGSADPGFFLRTFLQDGADFVYAAAYANERPLSAENFPPGQWVSLTIDGSSYPPPSDAQSQQFDPRRVEGLGVTLGTTPTSLSTGTLRVLIDSVSIVGVNGASSVDFASGADGLLLNGYQVPPGTMPPLHHP